MKVILSRKGFDSQYGRMPSPILPGGTLLSLPIPSKTDMETKYRDLYYGNSSYYDIIHTLNPNNKIKEEYNCHLDPDIREEIRIDQQGGSLHSDRKRPHYDTYKNREWESVTCFYSLVGLGKRSTLPDNYVIKKTLRIGMLYTAIFK